MMIAYNIVAQINRSSYRRYSIKKVFINVSQKSQENTCARASFLTNLQASAYLPMTASL